jgi:hypothetical protein
MRHYDDTRQSRGPTPAPIRASSSLAPVPQVERPAGPGTPTTARPDRSDLLPGAC